MRGEKRKGRCSSSCCCCDLLFFNMQQLHWCACVCVRVSLGRGEILGYLGLSKAQDLAWSSSGPFLFSSFHHSHAVLIKHHTNSWHYFIPDFIPFLKALFHNPVYMLFICITVLQFSAFDGMISFMPKYLEQQFGKSASDAIFLIGMFAFFFALFYQLVMSLFKLSLFLYIYICSCIFTYT